MQRFSVCVREFGRQPSCRLGSKEHGKRAWLKCSYYHMVEEVACPDAAKSMASVPPKASSPQTHVTWFLKGIVGGNLFMSK